MSDPKVLPFRPRRTSIRELTARRPPPPAWAPGVTVDVGKITQAIRDAITIDAPAAPDQPKKPRP